MLISLFVLSVFFIAKVNANVALTGDIEADLPSDQSNVVIVSDGNDVGVPPGSQWAGVMSGWDIKDLRFLFDPDNDLFYIGVNCFGICGDADGNGDPSTSSSALTDAGGFDAPNLRSSEAILVALDLGSVNSAVPDGQFDIIVGVPQQATTDTPAGCVDSGLSCFGVYRYKQGEVNLFRAPEYLTSDPLVTDAPSGNWKNWAVVQAAAGPSATSPDLAMILQSFGELRKVATGSTSLPTLTAQSSFNVGVGAFAGSFQDDGVGEDTIPNGGGAVTISFGPGTTAATTVTAATSVAPTPGTSVAPTPGTSLAPTPAAIPTPFPTGVLSLTGNVESDWPSPGERTVVVDDAGMKDVGVPPGPQWVGVSSGWDIKDLRFHHDGLNDLLYIGVNCFGVCGDAEGNGDPNTTAERLTDQGGVDIANFALSEAILIALDLGSVNSAVPDNQFDIIVGVPGDATTETPAGCIDSDLSCFGVYRYKQGESQLIRAPEYVSSDPLVTDAPNGNWRDWAALSPEGGPSANAPDFQFTLQSFNALRKAATRSTSLVSFDNESLFDIRVAAYAGSYQDDGIGEDTIPNGGGSVLVAFGIAAALPDTPAPSPNPTVGPTPLVTSVAPTPAGPTPAPTPFTGVVSFTGNVEFDWPAVGPRTKIATDGDTPDVGVPPGPQWSGMQSGWDVKDVRFHHDPLNDKLYIGINCFGICSDADGNGDPSTSSAALTDAGGVDTPKLAQSEALLVALDFGSNFSDAPDDVFDIIVGVPGQATTDTPAGCVNEDLSCFGVYRYKQGEAQIQRAPEYLSSDSLVTNAPNGDWKNWASFQPENGPSANAPDFEIVLNSFNNLRKVATQSSSLPPVTASTAFSIGVAAFSGSFQDDGVGEDRLPNAGNAFTVQFEALAVATETPAPLPTTGTPPPTTGTPPPTTGTPPPTPAPTPLPFSGNLESDFKAEAENVEVFSSMLEQDIVASGVDEFAVAFDASEDSLSIGVGCTNVCGETEARKRATKQVSIALDLGNKTSTEPDGKLDVVVARSPVDGKLGVYRISGDSGSDVSFGEEDRVPATIIDRNPMPTRAKPDYELTIENFDAVRQSAFQATSEEYVSLKTQQTFTIAIAPLKSQVDPSNSMKVTISVAPSQPTLQAKFVARIAAPGTTISTSEVTSTSTSAESRTTTDSVGTSSSTSTVVDEISAASVQSSTVFVSLALVLFAWF